ncbi:MAG: hypothetical protein WC350_04220 [Candidatus Micrarchaeia archaeon]|jgi:hypothetical protein
MAGAGSRSRERVPTIDELKENGYSNVMQTRLGDNTYLIAVKDSLQVDLTSMSLAELRTWAIQNIASIRVFETNARGRITKELNRRDISELPLAEEAAPAEAARVVPAPVEAHLRLGKDANPRTKQIIRALESRTYEGITFPAAGARAEFFQQFSDQERAFLQRAWDFAGTKERELFAAELNAFFAEAGDGRMGMMTLAKILQRMASDYLSHQGAYAQSRFFTIVDLYQYASSGELMAGEKTVGGAREHSIGGIARAMKGSVERKYDRLVDELKEERRTSIIRRLPGLEQVPTPAGAAQVETAPVEAQRQLPSALDRMYMHYSQIEFDQYLISRLPANSPQLPNMQASMRAHEDQFLEFVQTLPPEVQEAAKWRIRAINERRAAELSALVPAQVAAAPAETVVAPAEEAPATAAVEAAPAEAAQAEVYDYARMYQIAERIGVLVPVEYDLGDPRIFDVGLFPDTGEEVHGLYRELYAHFADMDALIASGTLTAEQAKFLRDTKTKVSAALQAAGD